MRQQSNGSCAHVADERVVISINATHLAREATRGDVVKPTAGVRADVYAPKMLL